MKRNRRARAFTLIELLAVIAMIGILLTIGLSSFETNDGLPLGVASDQFESAARTARERALASGRPVLLAFVTDPSNPQSDRRSLHMHVSGDDGWEMVANPEFLPEGIYFDTTRSTGLRTGTLRPRRDEGEKPFSGIVFRPDQFCEEGGARFVLYSALREVDGSLRAKRAALSTGFLVSRTGHVTRWEGVETGS